MNDVSTGAPVELADIRRAFDDDMTVRGMRPVAASVDAQVEISISRSLAGFQLVAEVRRGDAQQVAVVGVAERGGGDSSAGARTRLAAKNRLAAASLR